MGPSQLQCGRLKGDETTGFGLHFCRRIPCKILFKKWGLHNCNVGVLKGMKKPVLECFFSRRIPSKILFKKWGLHNCNVGVLNGWLKTGFGLHFSRRIPSKILFKTLGLHNCNVGVLNGMKKLVLDFFFPADSLQGVVQEMGPSQLLCRRLKRIARLVLDCIFSGGFPPRFCSGNAALHDSFAKIRLEKWRLQNAFGAS